MEVSGSNGGVVYNQGSQHLELAGTNHQVQLTPEANNPGYYQASVGGQTYEYNSQTHAFSAPNAPEALSWNPAHQQMEVAGSNGSVVYNQGSQHLELAGTNHQVQLTPEPNSPGMYSLAGTNYEYNANSHSFSAPGTAEPLSWNPAQHQMEASPGV